ncbi:MAG TPA: FecR domain-containing protein, partial [Pyrinomonadaceae bacterium]
MKSNKELDAIFDRLTADIREEVVDPNLIESASARAWSRIADECAEAPAAVATPVEHIESCADFQSLIPAYLKGELSEARTLLLVDHTHECIPCRRAMKAAREGRVTTARPGKVNLPRRYSLQPVILRWGVAAALVIGFGLLAIPMLRQFTPFGGSLDATVQAAEGPVYRVADRESRALKSGDALRKGESIRTSKDARAVVKLGDGSSIEMKDRSEFSIAQSAQDTTIHLDRGQVIVQAAKRKSGHLYVDTGDSLVAVTGTTFSVNTGTKGSRVSVIEGEVRLDHAGGERVIRAGQQETTSPSIERVPLKQEVSWSRNAEKYGQLLSALGSLNKELNSVPRPGVRTSTRLLDLMPEGTVLYAALPNLTQTLTESQRIMQERINQNPALKEWWEKRRPAQREAGFEQVLGRVREFGEKLGDEIAVGAEMDATGKPVGPLVLATLKDPQGFRATLDQQLKSLTGEGRPSVNVIDDPLAATQPADKEQGGKEVFIWIREDLVAASPNLGQLQQLARSLQAPGSNRFAQTPFYSRVAEIYGEGAGLVVAADLEKIIAQTKKERAQGEGGERREAALNQLGLQNLKYFVFDQKDDDGKTHSRATLSFTESQHGITSWLAAPGPMGSLEYISPDANVVAGFVVKNPVNLVDDLLGVLDSASPGLKQQLQKLETEHALDVRKDIAAPLGGEFAFAIDGPVLPTPSWKMVFEVNDPEHLQQTFEHLVEEVNKLAAKEGKKGLEWEKSDLGGRTFYTLKSADFGLEVSYAYVN